MKKIYTIIIHNKLYILFFLPLFLFLIKGIVFGVDLGYLLAEGRYILQKGIPYIDPFTIHDSFSLIMHQWLTSILFYIIYHYLGKVGLILLELLMIFFIHFILNHLCNSISKNKNISLIISTIIMILIVLLGYIDIRPQIFTYFFLISFVSILDNYMIHQKNRLFLLPFISIIMINLHGAMWIFLFIFSIPFICEMIWDIVITKKKVKYNTRYIIIILMISFLCGFINPYGIDMITYIWKACDISINQIVPEMHHPYFYAIDYLFFTLILFVNFIVYMFYYKKYKDIRISYLFLLFGSILLFFTAPKSYVFISVFGIYPICYYLRKYKVSKTIQKYFHLTFHIIILPFIFLLFLIILFLNKNIYLSKDQNIITAVNYLSDHYDKKEIIPYNTRIIGPYLEYVGIKSYIDTRAELFLLKMNHKKDISNEYLAVTSGKIQLDDFIKNYHFTHLIFYDNDINYYKKTITNYVLIYDKDKIKIWVRKDLDQS